MKFLILAFCNERNNPVRWPLSFILALAVALSMTSVVFASENSAVFLKDFDGGIHSLDEYTGKGKWTIMMIWASDCHICNVEAKEYEKFHQAHKDKDAVMLGVSVDGKKQKNEAIKFIQRHAITFTNLLEEPENIMRMYSDMTGSAWIGTPTFMLFSPTGELRAAQAGAVPTHIFESFIAKEDAANKASEKKGDDG